jgi:hypothetical protein
MFCPLHQHWDHMLIVEIVWPDCRLKQTSSVMPRNRELGDNTKVDQTATVVNGKVVDFYFLVWSLPRQC